MDLVQHHKDNLIGLGLAWTAAIGSYYLIQYILVRKESGVLLKDSNTKYPVRLVEREYLSHNVVRLRFALPGKLMLLGLETGHHLAMSVQVNGKNLLRSYTPVTLPSQKGYFELIIKVYNATTEEPQRGAMTRYLSTMPIGSEILIRGPVGQTVYHGNHEWTVRVKSGKEKRTIRKIGLVAGGTGITPMLQIIYRILTHPGDATTLSLVFANSTEDDVFLKKELDELAREHPRLDIHYTISKSITQDWEHNVGRIDVPLLSRLPPPSHDAMIFVCGPNAFQKSAAAMLTEIGHDAKNVVLL